MSNRCHFCHREIEPTCDLVVGGQPEEPMVTHAIWADTSLGRIGVCNICYEQERFGGLTSGDIGALHYMFSQRGIFTMGRSFSEMFDRTAFDGEIGWATDKAMHFAGLRTENVPGRGPNYAQIFDDHVEVYRWIHAT